MAPLVRWLGTSREILVKPEETEGRAGREDPAVIAELIGWLHVTCDAHLTGSNCCVVLFGVLDDHLCRGWVVLCRSAGDSVLFVAGAVVALAGLNVHALVIL